MSKLKAFIAFLVLIPFLSSPLPVLAVEETPASEITPSRQEIIQQRQEEMQKKRQERQVEAQTSREQHRAEIISNIGQRLINIANRIIEIVGPRLQAFIDRLSQRASSLEEKAADVSEASDSLSQAQSTLNSALAKAAELLNLLPQLSESENPRDIVQTFRSGMREVRELLHQTRRHLTQAVQDLRSAAASIRPTQSPLEAVE